MFISFNQNETCLDPPCYVKLSKRKWVDTLYEVSAISNNIGKLLFFTDGNELRNKDNKLLISYDKMNPYGYIRLPLIIKSSDDNVQNIV
jgi:hypothetical protein